MAAETRKSRGVVFIHSTPAALCPHIEWAISAVLDQQVSLDWTPQPAEPGSFRTEFSWQGEPGKGAELASALRGWGKVRYEVTEDQSNGREGERFAGTPSLGIFHSLMGTHGDILVPEDRLKAAVVACAVNDVDLADEIARLLGKPWDDELEPFRMAGEGAPVRWLHQVV